ncbi:hypothetical protein [Ureibacillus sp. FSL W8-0352]|jgi:hypothetical protein|uniref:hypothetical protein n=1 Tax=Ureibacillus sp. FSL W8-0352 TaxID=2954596 RepID=UPI0030F77754
MSKNKLTIVPVKLNPLPTEATSFHSPHDAAKPGCVIKTALAEISFFNGVDEHIIQTIMRELKNL